MYKNPTDYELLWNYRGLVNLDLTGIFKTDWKTFYINDEKQVVNYDMLTNRRRDELVINDNKGEIYDTRTGIVTIPVSGVYEIFLDAEIMLDSETPIARLGKDLYQFPASNFEELKDKYAFELKLLKYSDADFVPTSIEIDRKFGKPNIYQNNDDWEYESQFPKLFPLPNKTMLIDASQNDKFVIGLAV